MYMHKETLALKISHNDTLAKTDAFPFNIALKPSRISQSTISEQTLRALINQSAHVKISSWKIAIFCLRIKLTMRRDAFAAKKLSSAGTCFITEEIN